MKLPYSNQAGVGYSIRVRQCRLSFITFFVRNELVYLRQSLAQIVNLSGITGSLIISANRIDIIIISWNLLIGHYCISHMIQLDQNLLAVHLATPLQPIYSHHSEKSFCVCGKIRQIPLISCGETTKFCWILFYFKKIMK